MARSRPYRRTYDDSVTTGDDRPQQACSRGDWCSGKTRDADGTWHPALTYQAYCHADTAVITAKLAEMPGLYHLLSAAAIDPVRSGGTKVRVPPGSRVLVNPAADALMREITAVFGSWAARVRDVPGLKLSAPGNPPGTAYRLGEDCAVLARHTGPLLALAGGWTTRVYDLPASGGIIAEDDHPTLMALSARALTGRAPARPDALARATATCRRCGRTLSRSPVSGWWLAADRLPTAFCDHDPRDIRTAERRGPVDPDTEYEIGDEEIVSIGDGWVKVMTVRDGTDAGAEILDLHHHADKLTGRTRPPREIHEGVPCRVKGCEVIGLERPEPPSDTDIPAMHSKCPACGDEMDREEFAQHVKRWSASPGVLACRRCKGADPRHEDCRWHACACTAGEHPRRPSATRPAALRAGSFVFFLMGCNTDPAGYRRPRSAMRPGFSCIPRVVLMLPTRGDGMLTTPQSADLLGVSPATIRQWRARGWLAPQGLDERHRPLHTREALRAAEERVRANGLAASGIDPRLLRKRPAAEAA